MKKFGKSIKKGATSVTSKVSNIGAKPTTKDDDFEEKRTIFNQYKKVFEEIKKEASKIQTELNSFGKAWEALATQFAEVLEIESDGSEKKYKDAAGGIKSSSEELSTGFGQLLAGIATQINVNEGLKKRIDQRDKLLLEMDKAAKEKDKDKKKEQKYNDSKDKYEEVNTKLIQDLDEMFEKIHPDFIKYYDKFVELQVKAFKGMADANEF